MTVIGAPRVPGAFVSRPHLDAFFDTDELLTIVRGLPGTGKSVAVAGWAGRTTTAGIWVHCDQHGADRAGFWAAVLAQYETAGLMTAQGETAAVPMRSDSQSKPGAVGLSRTAIGSREADTTALAQAPDARTVLRSRLRSVPHGTVLVIDSAQFLDDAVVQDLAELLPYLPFRVIAITRLGAAIDGGDVRIALAPVQVNASQLRFTPAEIASVLHLPEHDSRMVALERITRGVPQIVQAIAVSVADGADAGAGGATDLLTTERAEAVACATVTTLLRTSSSLTTDPRFALRIAVPEYVTGDLAVELTGRPDARDLLDADAAAGLGIWTDGADAPEFRYTPMVMAALRARSAAVLGSELPALQRRVAQWATRRGDYLTAIRSAVARRDVHLVNDIAIRGWVALMRDHGGAFADALLELPRRQLREAPLLEITIGLYYNATRGRSNGSRSLFVLAAIDGRRHRGRDAAEQLMLVTIESVSNRLAGRGKRADDAAARAAQLEAGLTTEERLRLGASLVVLQNQRAISWFATGHLTDALAVAEAALAIEAPGAAEPQLHSLALAAGLHAVRGDMEAAASFADAAEAAHGWEGWDRTYRGAFLWVARALLSIEQGDYATAQTHLAVLAPHLERLEHWATVAATQARIDIALGHALEGSIRLHALREKGVRAPLTADRVALLDATEANLLLAAGMIDRARAILRGSDLTHPDVRLAACRVMLVNGRLAQAREELALLVEERSGSTMSPRVRVDAYTMLAALHASAANEQLAMQALVRSVTLMRQHGLRSHMLLLPSGASGIPRGERLADLILGGEPAARRWIANMAGVYSPVQELTDRESAVLQALALTPSRTRIAAAQGVSENTVKTQLRSVYRKLGARSRDDALHAARKRGLL